VVSNGHVHYTEPIIRLRKWNEHHLVAATQSWDAVSRSEDTAGVRFWARVAFTFLFCFLLDFRSELIAPRAPRKT
jgi:hypothetical protein